MALVNVNTHPPLQVKMSGCCLFPARGAKRKSLVIIFFHRHVDMLNADMPFTLEAWPGATHTAAAVWLGRISPPSTWPAAGGRPRTWNTPGLLPAAGCRPSADLHPPAGAAYNDRVVNTPALTAETRRRERPAAHCGFGRRIAHKSAPEGVREQWSAAAAPGPPAGPSTRPSSRGVGSAESCSCAGPACAVTS